MFNDHKPRLTRIPSGMTSWSLAFQISRMGHWQGILGELKWSLINDSDGLMYYGGCGK